MKTLAVRMLDQLQIQYELREYPWTEDELDAFSVAAKIGLPTERVFKTLVVQGDRTGVMLACLPGSRELDLKVLAQQSGNKRVQMVSVQQISALTGYQRGGVSPLGTRKPYPVYLDESARDLNPISVSAGRRGLQILLAGADLQRAARATWARLTRAEAGA